MRDELAVEYEPTLEAPYRAREAVSGFLREHGIAEMLPEARLLVSELVSNAVRYAPGEIGLHARLTGTTLRVEVRESGVALPHSRGGRGLGLQIVDGLATRWGIGKSNGDGTVSWFELRRDRSESPARPHEN